MVLYVFEIKVSGSPLLGCRTVTSSNVLGLAQMSLGIKPTFSVIHLFKSKYPIGSCNNTKETSINLFNTTIRCCIFSRV